MLTQGKVNVSKFGPKLARAGGFINISRAARTLVFAGTFDPGGVRVAIETGGWRSCRMGAATSSFRY